MSGLIGRYKWLTAVAVLTLSASGAAAQLKPWPGQQPQGPAQQAWPGDDRPAASGRPPTMVAPPMMGAPPGMGMGAPQRENPCMTEFTRLRDGVEKAGKVAKSVNDRKGTREEFCKAITGLHNAQAKWVKYTGDNSKNCGIPPDVFNQLKAGQANLGKLRNNVCNAGATAGGPAAAPSLSDALGTSRMTTTTDEAPRKRGGSLDTLTGETIR